jgi:hypothetical protein
MLSFLRRAHFGTFAALTLSLSAFFSSVCPSGGSVGISLLCTFIIRAQKQSDVFYFLKHQALDLKTRLKHVPISESTQHPHCNHLTSAPFGHPCCFGYFQVLLAQCDSAFKCWGASPWPRPTAAPDVYPCSILQSVEDKDCSCVDISRDTCVSKCCAWHRSYLSHGIL